VDEHIPGTFLGDPVRIRQILVNLLSNAVKFTEEGGVTVSASSTRREDGSCEVHIFVKDTGIGIVAEKMDRLFHSFCQIDASTTRRYGGTGLGLAISRRLAEQMGGEISVESEAGKGSTFMVTIPAFACTRLDEEAAGRDAEGPAGDSKSGNCKSIYGQSVIRSSD
jgi:signal transduction histidine kinase